MKYAKPALHGWEEYLRLRYPLNSSLPWSGHETYPFRITPKHDDQMMSAKTLFQCKATHLLR